MMFFPSIRNYNINWCFPVLKHLDGNIELYSVVLQTEQRLAKDKLAKALESESDPNETLIKTIDRIKEALDKCEKQRLDSTDEDIYAGKIRLEFLIAKNGRLKRSFLTHLWLRINALIFPPIAAHVMLITVSNQIKKIICINMPFSL